ncbi:hypothetical protein D1097_10185 [Actinobacillus pleuropneumoniae serovar 4 str. M62]|nr:hypothetical protein D1097_10185 [Actinobacillus pleuropneumoniae serovar 4 str. M62]
MHSHPPNNNGEAPHHKASPLFFRPNFFLSLYAKKISTPQKFGKNDRLLFFQNQAIQRLSHL